MDGVNVLFLGTPAFAVPTLERLAVHPEMQVRGVLCQPDRPAGRGGELRQPAVKQAALRLGLPVFQPARIRSEEAWQYLSAHQPDVMVVVAYGQIIPRRVFELPPLGTINAHASLLPAYRGAAPIQWAIANGEAVTGVTTMRINDGLDTGDMLLRGELAIGANETALELSPRLAALSADLIVETLLGLRAGAITPQPQDDSRASLAPILKKEDGRIDWSWPAQKIYNRWRGFQPWPGLHSTWKGKQLAITRCEPVPEPAPAGSLPGTLLRLEGNRPGCVTGDGVLLLTEVQQEGRKRLPAMDFARGARLAFGQDRLE